MPSGLLTWVMERERERERLKLFWLFFSFPPSLLYISLLNSYSKNLANAVKVIVAI